MEVVKAKAWKELLCKNIVIPPAFDRLSKQSDTPTPFCVSLKALDGITGKNANQTSYQLKLSLFDITYKQFFGRSWSGPVSAARVAAGKAKLSYSQTVYTYTSNCDVNVVLVIELVAVENLGNGKSQSSGQGWTILRLFSTQDMPDVSSRQEPRTLKLDMYHGTPRALCQLEDPIEKNPNIQLIPGCQLTCQLQVHIGLLKIQHLLPENVIVGTGDIIPGLVDSTQAAGPSKDLLLKPHLLKGMNAYLDKVMVTLYPNIERFEDELCALLNEDRLNRENQVADGSSVSIIERRLLIGVHNGYCFVEKPEVGHLVPQDLALRRGASLKKTHQRTSSHSSLTSGNLGSTYMLRNRVPLNGMVYDPMFTIVFQLEYMIAEPLSRDLNKLAVSMNKTQNFAVVIRWSAWSPFATAANTSDGITLSFVGGPNPIPSDVLTYKLPRFDMESEAAKAEMTGSVSFRFIDSSKELLAAQDTAYSLAVPSQYYGSETSRSELMLAPASPYKPPLPGSATPRKRSVNELTKMLSFPTQKSEPPEITSEASPELLKRDSRKKQSPTFPHYTQSAPSLPVPLPYGASPPSTGQMMHPSSQLPFGMPPTSFLSGSPRQLMMSYPMIASQNAAYPLMHPSYPMEIHHVSDLPQVGGVSFNGDMQELPFTPVHAPVMALPPGSKSGTGLTRAAYARLYSAGFPPICDRHKETAEVVDPSQFTNFVMSKEESDPLQSNEIILQFLAFSRMAMFLPEGLMENHSTVFFTFQFYKFPPITTERLLLGSPEQELAVDKRSHPCILQRLNPDGSMRSGPPGYQVKYVVDPTHMKAGEGSLFVRHLSQQTLHIDVWDGDSLLLIGSSAVELKHLCRQGREAVQVTFELDIMATEVSEDSGNALIGDLNRGGSVRPVGVQTLLRGKLHLRLANVGNRVDSKSFPAPRTMPNPSLSCVIKSEKAEVQGSFVGGSLTSLQNLPELHRRTARANHLAAVSPELASLLHENKTHPTGSDDIVKSNRKLARMEAIRANQQNNENKMIPAYTSLRQQKVERSRDLKVMEAFRKQTKEDGIKNMLNRAITTEHVIHPSMGSAQFFVFQLKNPNNTEACISIQYDAQEISVVTDVREWRHFQKLNQLDTPVEEGLFSSDGTQSYRQVFLRPKEMVYVPFKYLSFEANHVCTPEMPGSSEANNLLKNTNAASLNKTLATRVHKISFINIADGKLISILALRVEPEPHIIDQTFRFHQPEQSFLKKCIRLPPFHNMVSGPVDNYGYQQLVVRCSDPNVICETYRRPTGEPQDVFIKAAVSMAPNQKRFFVCIYTDPYLSRPDQIWQFYLHALQRVDVSCVEGQTTRFSLILRGTQSARLVKCFCSHAGQMQVSPTDSFLLAPGAVHELSVGVRPLHKGTKFFYLHVVDVECHQLVRNWLVCVNCSPPVISKTYELQLPVEGGKGMNKRISYTNPYTHSKTFIISNNRNDLLQFKESRIEMQSKETRIIGLRFMPSANAVPADILIFINDEDDKNEETFCVKVTYITTDHMD